jgi:hypothetical protein
LVFKSDERFADKPFASTVNVTSPEVLLIFKSALNLLSLLVNVILLVEAVDKVAPILRSSETVTVIASVEPAAA